MGPDLTTVTISWEPGNTLILETVSVAEDVDLETDILGGVGSVASPVAVLSGGEPPGVG